MSTNDELLKELTNKVQEQVDITNDFVCRYAICVFCREELPSETRFVIQDKQWITEGYCKACETWYRFQYLTFTKWVLAITTEMNFGIVVQPHGTYIVNTRANTHYSIPNELMWKGKNAVIQKRNSLLYLGII